MIKCLDNKKLGTYYLSGKLLKELGEKIMKQYNTEDNIEIEVFETPYLNKKTLGFIIK